MNIVIAGYGVEGKASFAYYTARSDSVIIADERPPADVPEGVYTIIGPDAYGQLGQFDQIIRSPGISPSKLPYGEKVWSATNEFFARCPAPIIGVTGTKGKGTTCSLIASILRAAGKTVHLVGNIGVPALEELSNIQPNDVVVYELSSFQLWDLKKSPHIAVVLMIEPDHLDIHENFNEYVAAKANIACWQKVEDTVIYHAENKYSKQIAFSGQAKKQRYGTPEDGGVYVKEGQFFGGDHAICSVSALRIAGMHNWENACAAITAVKAVESDVSDSQVADGLGAFTGLPHRLKLVREIERVRFYDDSISTTPGSAIAALRAFSEPKVIMLGGSDKGAQYNELVDVCKETNATVIAIGQTGTEIADLCRQKRVDVEALGRVPMGVAVQKAYEKTKSGGVVLLSPASASFDQYKNYADRGEQFIAAVEVLK